MSTRAMYTFKDKHDTIHVYKHCDGYPEGGLSWIVNTQKLAWNLPRFEASDFAAAFVGANKAGSGNVRLCGTDIQDPWQMSADSQYHYTVTCNKGALHVQIDEVNWRDTPEKPPQAETLFAGTLDAAVEKFGAKFAA